MHIVCLFHPQVQPDLQQAIEVDNAEATENLRDQLAAYCEVLDAGFSKLGVKQQSQIWLQVGPVPEKALYARCNVCADRQRKASEAAGNIGDIRVETGMPVCVLCLLSIVCAPTTAVSGWLAAV